MKHEIVSIGLYFEISDSEMYGGKGTLGYASIAVKIKASDSRKIDLYGYARSEAEGVAEMHNVPPEKVRIISRSEYEENTDE